MVWTTAIWQPTWWFWLLVALVAVLLTLILAGLAALFTYYCFLNSGRQSESLTRIELHQNSPVYARVYFDKRVQHSYALHS